MNKETRKVGVETYQKYKQKILVRATHHQDWGAGLFFREEEGLGRLSDLEKDIQEDIMYAVRAKLILENKQDRLDEIVRFAERLDIDYAEAEHDVVAAKEHTIYDRVNRTLFARDLIAEYIMPLKPEYDDETLQDKVTATDRKNLQKNLDKLEEVANKDRVKLVLETAIQLYQQKRDRMQEEENDDYKVIEVFVKTAEEVFGKYID